STPKTLINSLHATARNFDTPSYWTLTLERQFCPIFAPKNDRNKALSIFPVVFLFSDGKED
ncbi:hypothetical protein, partial [Eubacterium ramulus]|uniref:hypothetical protein n=1 Tax=Eubacterium ramulus TaxID=39490 RepID=UPI0035A2EB9C